jgi:hypothetical protein
MTRPARRILSASTVLAMAVGTLLLAPARAGAVTPSSGRGSTVAPAPQRLAPGELQGPLDQIVAAGAPGAAALTNDEGTVQQAASGVADLRTGRPMQPGLHYRVGSVTKSFVATVDPAGLFGFMRPGRVRGGRGGWCGCGPGDGRSTRHLAGSG